MREFTLLTRKLRHMVWSLSQLVFCREVLASTIGIDFSTMNEKIAVLRGWYFIRGKWLLEEEGPTVVHISTHYWYLNQWLSLAAQTYQNTL